MCEKSVSSVDIDARIIARDISLGAIDRAEYWDVIVPRLIRQYGEAYHARECNECNITERDCYTCAYNDVESNHCSDCIDTYAKNWKARK